MRHPVDSAQSDGTAIARSDDAEKLRDWYFVLAACSIPVVFVLAALVVTYFASDISAYVTRSGQGDIVRHGSIHGAAGEQDTNFGNRDSRKGTLAPQGNVKADQDGGPAAPQQAARDQERIIVLEREVTAARQELATKTAQHRQTLEEERARGTALAQELESARQENEKQAALVKAGGEVDKLRQEEAAKSTLSRDRDREKITALEWEAAVSREALATSTAQHRQTLDGERARGAALEQELAAARQENEKQAALLKASDEAEQLRQAEAAKVTQLRERDQERISVLEREATIAREELAVSTAQHRETLEQERTRGAALAQELAAAREENEKQATLRKAGDEAEQPRRTEAARIAILEREAAAAREELAAGSAQHRQTLEQERTRGAALALELTAARQENEKQAALLKAGDEAELLRQAEAAKISQGRDRDQETIIVLEREVAVSREEAVTRTAHHRQELDEERARGSALAQELVAARQENQKQAAKAGDEAEQLRQALAARISVLEREAAVAREELAANTAQHRQTLEQERAGRIALAQELEAARQENERQVALLKAGKEAEQLRREREITELQQDLTRDHEKATAPGVEIGGDRRPPGLAVGSTPPKAAPTVGGAVTAQPAMTATQSTSEVMRLVARAGALLSQGDIGAARVVLERASDAGSATASFMLAETYDPAILATWGTYGTRSDLAKAREFYARAHAGGNQDANNRLNALRQ